MKSSRDATLIDQIVEHLRPFHGDDERLSLLLSLCLGRIMLRAASRGEDWPAVATDAQIRHISDWLKASIVNESAWLKNVDDTQRPKKLMKFATAEAIVAEADKAMRKAVQTLSSVKLIEGDEVLHQELDDGYYIVRLLTPASLDRESAMMQHCIGNGAYDEKVIHPNYVYLSLRSPSGKAHATVEIKDGEITQLSGKQNQVPIKAHLERLSPFLRSAQYDASSIASSLLGYAIDDTGRWHSLDALPDELNVGSHLILENAFTGALPKKLKVRGNLYLYCTHIRSLPIDLEVGGNLHLPPRIDALPEGLKVGGDISINGKNPSLPERFSFGGSIHLARQSVINFPEGFHVVGDLGLKGNSITALPAGLSVGGNLKLDWSKIEHLPEGLHVGGDLSLSSTPISVLPKGLTVGGSLHASSTRISALPEGLNVGKHLYLSGSPISCLPEGMKVGGDLYISGTKITALPKSLTVARDLGVGNSSISFLPDDLIVGRHIGLVGTHITALPKSIADETVIYDDDGDTTAAAFRKKHAARWC